MATTIISDITSRIMPTLLSTIGYDEEYDSYVDIIEATLKDRGSNRVLTPKYTASTIATATINWLKANKWNVTRLLDIPGYDYNPTHNYDGTESESISYGAHTDETTIGARSSSDTIGAKTTTDTINKNAYNDSSLAVDTQESIVDGAQTNSSSSQSATDSTSYGAQIQTRSLTKGGNLGITTTESLLLEELQLLGNNNPIYAIVDKWLNDFTIAYYFSDDEEDNLWL